MACYADTTLFKQIKAVQPSGKTYTVSTISTTDSTDNVDQNQKRGVGMAVDNVCS